MEGSSGFKSHKYITKKRYSTLLIFCIFCTQFAYSTIIYYLKYITDFDHFWIASYHTAALFFALPQAGLSDSQGRKKHLIIALLCVLLSFVLFFVSYIFVQMVSIPVSEFSLSLVTVLPICLLLGVAGNVIPIARAGLTDLKIHDFRVAVGWSTVSIGFGWGAPILLGLVFSQTEVMILSIVLLLISVWLVKSCFFDPEDVNTYKNIPVRQIFKNSYVWFISMFSVTGGALAIFAYLFSEISFYQVNLLAAEGSVEIETQIVGLIMAFGYAGGIIIQWIVYNSDEKGIKLGRRVSLISLFFLCFFKVFSSYFSLNFMEKYYYFLECFFYFLFSFGFGFLIPSLFSLMARKIRPHHAGRLFGAIDITDTFALNISALVFFFQENLAFNHNVNYTLALFLFCVAFFCYKYFLRRFSTYEKYF